MTIVLEVYETTDMSTPVATLPYSRDRACQDELRDAAVSRFSLSNYDPDYGEVQLGRVVRWMFDGNVGPSHLVERVQRATISQDEEHGQLTEFSGRQVTALLSWPVVYPTNGTDTLPVEVDRMFAWTSPEYIEVYDGDPWPLAVEIARQDDVTPYWVGTPLDSGDFTWSDPTAYWIGSSTGDSTNAPLGTEYFRRKYTTTAGFYVVQFGAFYYGDLWIDGVHILSTGTALGRVQQETVELSAGEHTFAFVVENVANGGDDPAGGIFALYTLTPLTGELGPVEMHSDSAWSMLAFATLGQPGMTPGEVAEVVLLEAQARGELLDVTWDFTGELDSNGDPWVGTDFELAEAGTVFDCATKVGTDLQTFFDEMAGANYIEFWIDHLLDLHIVNPGGRGGNSGFVLTPPTDPNDPSTGNILSLSHVKVDPVCNKALVAWSGGFHEVTHFSHVAAYGVRGGLLSLGAQQATPAVEAVALAELEINGQPQTEYVVTHRDVGGWQYGPGDTVTVPDEDLNPVVLRVMSVTVDEDEQGNCRFRPTFGEPLS